MLRPTHRTYIGLMAVVLMTACVPFDEPPVAPVATKQTAVRPEPVAKAGDAPRPAAEDAKDAALEPAALKSSIVLGTDELVNPRASLRSAAGSAGGAGDVTLNFTDADIREVARSVLGDILQVNYTVDPSLSGTVTLQTSRPVARDSLLPTLESVLRVNGAGLVREGGLYKVIPLDRANQGAVPLRAGQDAGGPGIGVQVVPLRFIAASEMATLLEHFAPQGSVLNADDGRNVLILSGTRADRQALLDAVELFDVDWIAGMSFGVFPLQNANAETLVSDLQAIFSKAGFSPSHELLRFIPVARLNSVIAISPRAHYLEQAQDWIMRLDQNVDSASERIFVYYVQNIRAADLAEVLGEVFDDRGQSPSQAAPRLEPSLIPATLRSDVELPPSDDGDGPVGAPPVGAAPLNQRSSAGDGIAAGGNDQVRIIADEATNSLLVMATPQSYRMVEQAIRKLDIVPLQVLIEATIAEVTLNDALRYGVQWFFDSGETGDFTLSEFVDGAVGQVAPGFSYLYRLGQDVRVVLNALSNVSDVNVISSPQLMVLDNQTAEIQVGDQVPIATQSAVSVQDPAAPIVNSIEFRDTGVILRVTPRVNAGGLVVMDIEQEVSSVVNTTTSGIDSPTIQQRKIRSSVAIQSGETVTLGGLISESQMKNSDGVPLLSEIPVVGSLFGLKRENEVRTELLVLITPRVVANQLDARQVTEELRARLRAVQPLGRRVQ